MDLASSHLQPTRELAPNLLARVDVDAPLELPLLPFPKAPRRVRPAMAAAAVFPGKGEVGANPTLPQLRAAGARCRAMTPECPVHLHEPFALGFGLEAGAKMNGSVTQESSPLQQ